MIQGTYTTLYALAALATVATVFDFGARRFVGGMAAITWLALIPSSWAVETVTDSGAVEVVAQPTLGFLAIAGLGVAAVFTVIDVIDQLRPRRDSTRLLQEVLR